MNLDFEKIVFADLHIHSRFSRACSKDLNFPNLVKWARVKGINLLGTGDFTHPVWLEEIKNNLKNNGEGIYFFYGEDDSGKNFEEGGFEKKIERDGFPFVISGEVSLMYTHNGKGRRVHLVLLLPSVEVAEKINSYLDTKGRRDYDGRPIFKIPCGEFVEEMMKISNEIEIIPAHIWTPWFGIFGSATGYNSLAEAFGNQLENVHGIETGISSDPEMNFKISELRGKTILSFSDSHSFWPFRLGREVTIFKKLNSYSELIRQIRENDVVGTIETDPAYGKYHWDGHAKCNFSCSPEKTKSLGGVCPVCGGKLVVGVDFRVEELSDNLDVDCEKIFFRILPLHEIISLAVGVGMTSKRVWGIYNSLIEKFENEFKILLEISKEDLMKVVDENLAELILQNRRGEIRVKAGYDGVYGVAEVGVENSGEEVVGGKNFEEKKGEKNFEKEKSFRENFSGGEKQMTLG